MTFQRKSGGMAAWSIQHPVAVISLVMTVIVLGGFSLSKLGVDLLPHLIYPEVRVRILDPGVPANIMEDNITRQLEEQLAITENAINIQSSSSEGRSAVDLSFPYGTDIDIALRDASTRLDRAKRFLPTTIDPPVIYKRDPSQRPVLEYVISSDIKSPVEIRSWVDYNFSKWFLNLPGVAAAEVGGGMIREISVVLDPQKMAHYGLTADDVITAIKTENQDIPGGRLLTSQQEISTRASARFKYPAEIAQLLIKRNNGENSQAVYLKDVASVDDTHEDERLRVRLNNQTGVKLSIQKQPTANTVIVVDQVNQRLKWLRDNNILPEDIKIEAVGDQSVFIRHSINNASSAAVSGAILAMLVVYLFLGNIKRTLIIGSAIPIAILVTFIIMAISGITLNIMTLGGLALGIGMLVDSTIVMLENISRHQQSGESEKEAAVNAAAEVYSPVVASTSTNLAAVIPFLFISGLIGLLFKELIITIAAAMLASLFISLTLVPALGSRIKYDSSRQKHSPVLDKIKSKYASLVGVLINHAYTPFLIALPLLFASIFFLIDGKSIFLPRVDEGSIYVNVATDPGTQLKQMDSITRKIENILLNDSEVESVFTLAGGFIFGRSEYQRGNRSTLTVQLLPSAERNNTSQQWIKKIQKQIAGLKLAGVTVRMRVKGVRGVRLGSGDDDVSIRVRGQELNTLAKIGDEIIERLKPIKGLSNLEHSYEDSTNELLLNIKRDVASQLGISAETIGNAMRLALDGVIASDLIDGDRQYNIRVRYDRNQFNTISSLQNIVVTTIDNKAIYLNEVADFKLNPTPKVIKRDKQQRIVEVTASLSDDATLSEILDKIEIALADYKLPEGYYRYDGGEAKALQESQNQGNILLGLALFLVFVVMAIQYESFINPLIILFTIPFALIGVVSGIYLTDIAVSMPVWLGMIMLAGIVVNNAIVLIEQIEIEIFSGMDVANAIIKAASLRLRPILMTTLTTVVGMLPLAIGFGEGSEMLQPLAIVIVFGLSFSTLISLVLVPSLYRLVHSDRA